MTVIYLDHQATTPLDPAVLAAMLPFLQNDFANPGSLHHAPGRRAAAAVEAARAEVATLIAADPREIIFTSGATEANNLAIFGLARYGRQHQQGEHLITGASEHKSILEIYAALAAEGFSITILPVDKNGCVEPQAVREAIRPETLLISLMFANNEVGTLHDLASIGGIAKAAKVFFHADAAQGLTTETLDVDELGVDLLSLSAHKMYGPKGVGALYLRRKNPRVRLLPILCGGGQERGVRPGTLNVPGIVGFGKAGELAKKNRAAERTRLLTLREQLFSELRARCERVRLNGHPTRRLAGNLSLSFAGIEANELLCALPEVAASSGAACSSTVPEPSHVLRAMGVPFADSQATIRLGIGRFTTAEEVSRAAEYIAATVKTLRGNSSR